MLIVHKGKTFTNKRNVIGIGPEESIDCPVMEKMDLWKISVFAKEACEKGVCTSIAEGHKLFHHLQSLTPKSCPCPVCFKCCCSQVKGLEDHAEKCVNKEHGICTCRD